MKITSAFDSGNIEVLSADRPDDIRLSIRKDNQSDFYQWFHYRVSGVRGVPLTMHLVNAATSAFPDGWPGYHAVASYDRQRWFRAPTVYEEGRLTIRHTPEADAVYYAYFAPYSLERHADLCARAQMAPGVRLEVLGSTVDGRDIDLLTFGEPSPEKRTCWIIARQHPGESMAEWLVEGLIDRLLDPEDPVGRILRERAVFHVVPNMNPDGSFRGHLRTNAVGANLNREWVEPTLWRSPEVFCVRRKIEETGVDFFLDVHGDEGLPYNFLAGAEGILSVTPRVFELERDFQAALKIASPDFQTEHGYPSPEPGQANLTMASNYVADVHGCLSVTLEQPFKDAANAPLPELGWSPARCRRLGYAVLDALLAVVDRLR
ncbi:MAG: carboxypeptidase family protein [Myxococcales bacterium]|nr:carboxypeptidase family protein [Myxococcales bacterium]